jgi:hypothetical protein
MLTAEDQLAIARLVARYNHATDLGTPEQYAALFTHDAEFDASPIVHCHGREDLLAFGRTFPPGRRTRHWNTNLIIEGDGDEATTEVYLMMVTAGSPSSTGMTGVYRDKVVRVDGQWLFAHRKLTFEDPTLPA